MSTCSPSSSQPVGMTDILNPSEEHRDSAYYSNGEASKHASTVSNNPQNLYSPPSYNSSAAGNTPSPTSVTVSPTSNTSMSVAAMVSPTTPSSMDSSMLAKLDTRPAYPYDASQRTSTYSLEEMNGRRESVGESRSISNGFEGMKLHNGSSPYHSNNQSTTSIQSSLLQQRTPATPAERLSASRFPNSYQPNTTRFSGEGPKQSTARIAPPITSPPVSSIANALEPAKGQAWAFPDSNDPPSRQTSYIDSRRSSIADSLASSQFTTESRLPHGQRRLDESYLGEFNRLSRASSEFQGPSHHHHSLQHNQLGELRDEEVGSPGNGQPYSRTPELRVSHKLAERKRRNEMKELYDELRDLMPQERGSKASKWEILSKAIQEHKRQDDYIRQKDDYLRQREEQIRQKEAYIRDLETHCRIATSEAQRARDQVLALEQEKQSLATRLEGNLASQPIQQAHQPLHRIPQPPAPIPAEYPRDPYARTLPLRQDRAELPPLSSIGAPMPPPDAMSGVTYQMDTGSGQGYGSRPSTSNYQGPPRI